MMSDYHDPVLLEESLEGLNLKSEGVYVDATFGGGGHSRALLKRINSGRLFSFDQDDDAVNNSIDDPRFCLVEHNFKYARNFLEYYDALPIDGMLADLGVSSHQFDTPGRGFSFRFDEEELDMRMNTEAEITAQSIINTYAEKKLADIFFQYGEVHNARKLASRITAARATKPIKTVGEFKSVIADCAPKFNEYKYYAQVFQALRIEVNEELEVLKDLLEQSAGLMKQGGRLVVISYHSLEDRLVKQFIAKGRFSGEVEKDLYGNEIKPYKAVNRKPIVATEEEMNRNPRARSARLRIAEKL